MTATSFIWVALGGAVGSVFRYGVAQLLLSQPSAFPKQTLLVNLAGSLFIGLLFGLLQRQALSSTHYQLLAVGFCGGFTTFSAVSLEALQMLKQEQYGMAAIYVSSTLILGLAAAASGYYLSKQL